MNEELLALLSACPGNGPLQTINGSRLIPIPDLKFRGSQLLDLPFSLPASLSAKHLRELNIVNICRLEALLATEPSRYVQSKAENHCWQLLDPNEACALCHRLPTQAPRIAASVRMSFYFLKMTCTKPSLRAQIEGTRRLLKPLCRNRDDARTVKPALAIPSDFHQS